MLKRTLQQKHEDSTVGWEGTQKEAAALDKQTDASEGLVRRRLAGIEREVEPYTAKSPMGVPEFRLYQPRAGHPDWPRLFAEAKEFAASIEGQLERPRTGWVEWRRRWRAYRTTFQNFRDNRRLDRLGREDLRPLYFIWTTLRSCNFRCTYCDDHQGHMYPMLPNKGVLDTEQGEALLRVMRTRTPSVYFAGGEPTMRKDLPKLTRVARDLDYYPIIVNTNGSLFDRLLQQDAWRSYLADIDILVVSLDALDLEHLREMWVTKRPHEVLRNLLILRELSQTMKFKLMVNCVIQPGQTDHARDVLDLANDLGIWFCPVPMNVGPRVHGGLHQDPGYQSLSQLILERHRAGYRITGSLRMNQRLLSGAHLDCRNTLKPHVDFDGHLFWPCKASVNVAPKRLQVLDYQHLDELYAEATKDIDPTNFHGPGPDQCGADCNWAQNYSTDAYLHGLRNPLSLLGEVTGFLQHR